MHTQKDTNILLDDGVFPSLVFSFGILLLVRQLFVAGAFFNRHYVCVLFLFCFYWKLKIGFFFSCVFSIYHGMHGCLTTQFTSVQLISVSRFFRFFAVSQRPTDQSSHSVCAHLIIYNTGWGFSCLAFIASYFTVCFQKISCGRFSFSRLLVSITLSLLGWARTRYLNNNSRCMYACACHRHRRFPKLFLVFFRWCFFLLFSFTFSLRFHFNTWMCWCTCAFM